MGGGGLGTQQNSLKEERNEARASTGFTRSSQVTIAAVQSVTPRPPRVFSDTIATRYWKVETVERDAAAALLAHAGRSAG